MLSKFGETVDVASASSPGSLEAHIDTMLAMHPALRDLAVARAGSMAMSMVEVGIELPELFATKGHTIIEAGGLTSEAEITAITAEITVALGGLVVIFTDPANPGLDTADDPHFIELLGKLYRETGYDLADLPAAVRWYAATVWELPERDGVTPGLSGPNSVARFEQAFAAVFSQETSPPIPRQRRRRPAGGRLGKRKR